MIEKEFDFQLRVEFSHLLVDSLLLNATYPLQERSIFKSGREISFIWCIHFIYIICNLFCCL